MTVLDASKADLAAFRPGFMWFHMAIQDLIPVVWLGSSWISSWICHTGVWQACPAEPRLQVQGEWWQWWQWWVCCSFGTGNVPTCQIHPNLNKTPLSSAMEQHRLRAKQLSGAFAPRSHANNVLEVREASRAYRANAPVPLVKWQWGSLVCHESRRHLKGWKANDVVVWLWFVVNPCESIKLLWCMQGIRVAMKTSCQCRKPRDGFTFDCIIFTKKTFVPDCK